MSRFTVSRVAGSALEVIQRLEAINTSMSGARTVKVGLPKDSNNYPDGTSSVMVGAVHEFGSPSRNIPQRSFLREGLNKNQDKYKRMAAELLRKVIRGQISKEAALNLIGLQAQTDIREEITNLSSPPLKHRQGNPLVDTGHLRRSIIYKVGND